MVSQREVVAIDPVREAAFHSLRRVSENAAYANIVVDATLERHDWAERDRRLYTSLVYGTIRHRGLIDWVLGKAIGKKFPRGIHPAILAILRLGAYQILFLSGVPKYAAVNESVKLARKYGHAGTAGLVNAVLRGTKRGTGWVELPDKEEHPALYLATKYSHPIWLVERWLTAWGLDKTENVCAANNEVAPLTVRTNTLRVSVEELERRLRDEQVSVRKNTDVPEELEIVDSRGPISRLPSFRDGLFQVQDASSMCVGHLVAPHAGDIVVDLCAGPGGKTTHLAQLMHNTGTIIATDLKPHRLSLIRENCRMLGVTIVRCIEGDARRISEVGVPAADKALVDAPCTGMGTFRRRVDLKWRLTADSVEQLAAVQKELIAAGASVLKPGGVLVYSVCSVDPAETEDLVRDEFVRVLGLTVDTVCPRWMKQFKTARGHFMIMPGQMRMDGFFMARFVKTG